MLRKGQNFGPNLARRVFAYRKAKRKNIENIYSFQIMISNKNYKFFELKKYGKSKSIFLLIRSQTFQILAIESGPKKTARSFDLVIQFDIMDTVHLIL